MLMQEILLGHFMKKLKNLLLILGTFIPCLSFAQNIILDGYKDLKFGMTYQQIADSKLCTGWKYYQPLNSYKCQHFLFNGNNREATAYFNGQVLNSIAIDILNYSQNRPPFPREVQEVKDILNGLPQKYGPPTKVVCGADYARSNEECNINTTDINFDDYWMVEFLNGQIRLVNSVNQWVILVYSSAKTILDSL